MRSLVIIVERSPDGQGKCRRCKCPVLVDDATIAAIVGGAALLCQHCSTSLYVNGAQFDPAAPEDYS